MPKVGWRETSDLERDISALMSMHQVPGSILVRVDCLFMVDTINAESDGLFVEPVVITYVTQVRLDYFSCYFQFSGFVFLLLARKLEHSSHEDLETWNLF